MFNDAGEFAAAFSADFDAASIQKKRAAQFEAPLQVDRISLKTVLLHHLGPDLVDQ